MQSGAGYFPASPPDDTSPCPRVEGTSPRLFPDIATIMKQRITYLLRNAHEEGGVDPATLSVGKDSIKIPGIDAAKEWRITVGASELPQEVWYTWPLLDCSCLTFCRYGKY